MKQKIFLVVAVCVAFFVGAVSWIFVAGYRRPVVELPVAPPVERCVSAALARLRRWAGTVGIRLGRLFLKRTFERTRSFLPIT